MAQTIAVRPFSTDASRLGMLALVAANAVVAVQALLHGWGYYETLLVYWFEALIIGGYNALRMLIVGAAGERPFGTAVQSRGSVSPGLRLFFTLLGTAFFVCKFGGVALGIGFVVASLPTWSAQGDSDSFVQVMKGLQTVGPGVALSAAVLFASHGISFVRNFLLGGEYRTRSVLGLIVWPYARVAFVACVLVVGVVLAWVLPGAQESAAFVTVMVTAKTAADLAAHMIEHRPRRLPMPASVAAGSPAS